MSNISPPNLGAVISNGTIRKIIYGTYVVALVVAGAVQVAYGSAEPEWLTATLRVIGYLGIPVGSLALANTPPKVEAKAPYEDGEGLFQ